MKLADKIIQLRKQCGWSQEELAEKMNVSRQSVSKWESAMSIPDMNKILRLSEIFSVTTDFLLKDEIESSAMLTDTEEDGVLKINLEQVTDYLNAKKEVANITAKAVLIFISAAAPMFLLLGLSFSNMADFSENLAIGVGTTILLVMVSAGIAVVLGAEKYKKNIEFIEEQDVELQYGVDSVIKENAEVFMETYTRSLSISVSMFVLSPLIIVMGGLLGLPDHIMMYLLSSLLFIIATGVYMLVPKSSEKEAYDRLLGKGDFARNKRKEVKRTERIAGFYWPMVVAVYLAWSFISWNWGITWIVWPIAAVTFPAVLGFVALFDKD